MADEPKRPPDGKGRRGVSRRLEYRRPRREAVPAGPWGDGWYGDDEGEAGSAGVREPRHPEPLGPLADAGESPVPESPALVTLPDPRR